MSSVTSGNHGGINDKKTRLPRTIDPAANFPYHGEIYKSFRMPSLVLTAELAKPRAIARKALHYSIYEHLLRASRGEPGYDPYRIPSKALAARLGFDISYIGRVASAWREFFGFKRAGHRGGHNLGFSVYPKDIIAPMWEAARRNGNNVSVQSAVLEGGKRGLLMNPYTVANWVKRLNKEKPGANVSLDTSRMPLGTSLPKIRRFLESRKITNAVSVRVHRKEI